MRVRHQRIICIVSALVTLNWSHEPPVTLGHVGDRDHCTQTGYCEHGGHCEYTGQSFYCACTPAYHGDRCQFAYEGCIRVTCAHGGTCHIAEYVEGGADGAHNMTSAQANRTGSNSSSPETHDVDPHSEGHHDYEYHCDCTPGYKGANCEFHEISCASSPCQNGATCNDLISGEFVCRCTKDFIGILCSLDKHNEKVDKYENNVKSNRVPHIPISEPKGEEIMKFRDFGIASIILISIIIIVTIVAFMYMIFFGKCESRFFTCNKDTELYADYYT